VTEPNDCMNEHRGIRPWAAFSAFVFLLAAALQGCGSETPANAQGRNGGGPGRPQPKPAPIAVAPIKIGEAASYYATTSVLEAEHHAVVVARTTGVARELFHEEGDFVEAGDPLLQLEDDDQQLQLKQARITLSQLEQEYKRQLRLSDSGFLSSQEFEAAENALEQAKAELEAAQLMLSYTTVRAPFSGRVVRRHVDLGAHVQPGAQLYELMDVDPLLTRIHIPANRLGRVAVGQRVELALDSKRLKLTGTISLISPIVDPETGTVKVTAEISDYPSGVRAGDFAQARVVTDRRENAMLAQSEAVIEEQGQRVVYTVADGRAARRVVETGFIADGMTEIISGVEPEDLIVVKGQRDLRDGQPVEILEGGPSSAEEQSRAPVSEVG